MFTSVRVRSIGHYKSSRSVRKNASHSIDEKYEALFFLVIKPILALDIKEALNK